MTSSMVSNMVTTIHMWIFKCKFKKMKNSILVILATFQILKIHLWLMATILGSTELDG